MTAAVSVGRIRGTEVPVLRFVAHYYVPAVPADPSEGLAEQTETKVQQPRSPIYERAPWHSLRRRERSIQSEGKHGRASTLRNMGTSAAHRLTGVSAGAWRRAASGVHPRGFRRHNGALFCEAY